MDAGPYMRSYALQAEEDEKLDHAAVGAAEPVRHGRVELGRLTGRQRQVALAEDQPQAAVEHIQPLETFVRLEGRFEGAGRAGMIILKACTPPGRLDSGTKIIPNRSIGFRWIRGSPVRGAPTRSSSGTS